MSDAEFILFLEQVRNVLGFIADGVAVDGAACNVARDAVDAVRDQLLNRQAEVRFRYVELRDGAVATVEGKYPPESGLAAWHRAEVLCLKHGAGTHWMIPVYPGADADIPF